MGLHMRKILPSTSLQKSSPSSKAHTLYFRASQAPVPTCCRIFARLFSWILTSRCHPISSLPHFSSSRQLCTYSTGWQRKPIFDEECLLSAIVTKRLLFRTLQH